MCLPIFPVWLIAFLFASAAIPDAVACDTPASVCFRANDDGFALIKANQPATLVWDANADPAVRRVAGSFASDLKRVSGQAPPLLSSLQGVDGPAVVIGVLRQSPIIDELVQAGKLDVSGLAGQWEAFLVAVVEHPWPNVPRALVIVGSDRRGTVYGTYDLSEQMGVSPWHWFADVPVKQRSDVFVTAGARDDAPKVKYRGFFINDENPSFNDWAYNRFGGINSEMYEHVFELLLRLKGNYLWPAMWLPKAFYVDDSLNAVIADEMGVVIGTTHHEPMGRAHAEWTRKVIDDFAAGEWNYATNSENLRGFWRLGIERMMSKGDGQSYESVVTVGMRGDGDEAMAEGTAIKLLETIVADQRKIIEEVTGKPASETPQIWALYKEVQDYYDKGMQVPDDVTLLFADDNWGQIRRLPTKDFDRPGGYGVYYHFDYVGGPRNYKWLNTVQIEKVWQQMDLAYRRHAREMWIVNVGDIKPMEYPLDFFLDMAWDPEAMTSEALEAYPRNWAEEQFGEGVAAEIGDLLTTYSKYAARRKPELINADTWPIGEGSGPVLDGGEFGRLVDRWKPLVASMKATREKLDPDQHAAYFQLIEFPILALSNLYEMYYATAWNRKLAALNDPRANSFADAAETAFQRDAELAAEYHALEDGKWDGMMSDVHMNYVIWQTPDEQTMPEVTRVSPRAEGGEAQPSSRSRLVGRGTPSVEEEVPHPDKSGFGMTDVLTLEATAFDRSFSGAGLEWTPIPHLGQSKGAIVALPQGQPATTVDDGVRVEYDFAVHSAGPLKVTVRLNPTLDTIGSDGLRFGVSLDDGPVQTLVSLMHPTNGSMDNAAQRNWVMAVINNGHDVEAVFEDVTAGEHTLKLWRLDDNVVVEGVVVGG